MKARKFKNSENEKDFYRQLKNEVSLKLGAELTQNGDFNFWAKGIFWLIISYASYLLLFTTNSQLAFWGLYLVFQLAGPLMGFCLGHDASHNTAFKNKSANQLLHFFSFLSVGIDPLLWGLRHIRSHHLYANVEGSDIDIDKNPFLRLAPSHPWSKKHKYQHIYAPFVYMLALLHSVFMGDWIYLFSKDYDWMRKGVSKAQLILRFITFKLFYFTLVLVIPSLFTAFSFGFIFLTYVTTSAFTSLIFVVMLVGTHFFEEAKYDEPEGDFIDSSWAVHQLKTSCDWNPDSKFARILSGGANCHAAHHLFPNICHTNYDKINDVIEKIMKFFQKFTLLLSIISIFSCKPKTNEMMEEIKIINRTFTIIEDDIEPPPPVMKSTFENVNDWLAHICKNEKPNQPISHFKIGIFESPEENILCLFGRNSSEQGDTMYSTLDFEPKEMYFLLPSASYRNLSREQLLEKITSQIKDFTKTEAFKTSFFTKANDLTFEANGQIIWQKFK